jgi:hypothetical protein
MGGLLCDRDQHDGGCKEMGSGGSDSLQPAFDTTETSEDRLSSACLPDQQQLRHPHTRMRRGDSLLFEVADGIPLAPAPELIVSPVYNRPR